MTIQQETIPSQAEVGKATPTPNGDRCEIRIDPVPLARAAGVLVVESVQMDPFVAATTSMQPHGGLLVEISPSLDRRTKRWLVARLAASQRLCGAFPGVRGTATRLVYINEALRARPGVRADAVAMEMMMPAGAVRALLRLGADHEDLAEVFDVPPPVARTRALMPDVRRP